MDILSFVPPELRDFLKLSVAKDIFRVLFAFVLMLAGIQLSRLFFVKILKKRLTEETAMIFEKIVRYALYVIFAFIAFNIAGVDISALLGAAGIAGIALGFAAQTSVSNVISGIFLMAEHSFHIEDVISINGITGIVKSIDLLSVKLQTFDNKYVRVPNETLIKSDIVNITRYPIRRLDLVLVVPYSVDPDAARIALMKAAADNIYALVNPEPFFLIDSFDPSGWKIMFGVWFVQENIVDLKNSVIPAIKREFDARGIALSYHTVKVLTTAE